MWLACLDDRSSESNSELARERCAKVAVRVTILDLSNYYEKGTCPRRAVLSGRGNGGGTYCSSPRRGYKISTARVSCVSVTGKPRFARTPRRPDDEVSMTNRIRLSPPGTGAIHAMYPPLVASSGPIKARSRHGRSRRKAYGRRGPAPPRAAPPPERRLTSTVQCGLRAGLVGGGGV